MGCPIRALARTTFAARLAAVSALLAAAVAATLAPSGWLLPLVVLARAGAHWNDPDRTLLSWVFDSVFLFASAPAWTHPAAVALTLVFAREMLLVTLLGVVTPARAALGAGAALCVFAVRPGAGALGDAALLGALVHDERRRRGALFTPSANASRGL